MNRVYLLRRRFKYLSKIHLPWFEYQKKKNGTCIILFIILFIFFTYNFCLFNFFHIIFPYFCLFFIISFISNYLLIFSLLTVVVYFLFIIIFIYVCLFFIIWLIFNFLLIFDLIIFLFILIIFKLVCLSQNRKCVESSLIWKVSVNTRNWFSCFNIHSDCINKIFFFTETPSASVS